MAKQGAASRPPYAIALTALLLPAGLAWTDPAAADSPLAAAVLPASRSPMVNETATVFATMLNGGSAAMSGCTVAPMTATPMNFAFQATDATTNAPQGAPGTPFSLAGGGAQSLVLSFTPTAGFAPTQIDLAFACAGVSPASVVAGLDTVLLSGSTVQVPDLVALAATAGNTGTLTLSDTATPVGAFAVATVNLGSADMITASANIGTASLPVTLSICPTGADGSCTAAPAATATQSIPANGTPTFAVFASASGAIAFDPANNRIFVQFTDSTNAVRGTTSVALTSPAPLAPPPPPPPPAPPPPPPPPPPAPPPPPPPSPPPPPPPPYHY